ncbi:MAG: D-alanine--D-alanine ligase family protein [Nitrosospira sp.]
MEKLNIAYTCNVRKPGMEGERFGEFESPATIKAVIAALERTGANVELIDVGPDIYHQLERRKNHIDLVFNNAEGLDEKELREAIVPFFCEYLHIPYTGSSPKTFINKMDKATAKKIVSYGGVPTTEFQLMMPGEPLEDLSFPLMVKPRSEGTSIGISQKSKVHDLLELDDAVTLIYKRFNESALVEEFLPGDEYTIGIIGKYVLPILMIDYTKIPGQPQVRDPYVKDIENPFISYIAWTEKAKSFAKLAIMAHEALEVRDYNRMDFRERDSQLYFLEANVIPGIHPTEADLTNMCRHANIPHDDMIALIVHTAVQRLSTLYPARFTGKTELLEELADLAINKVTKAGSIIYRDRMYTLLGEQIREDGA